MQEASYGNVPKPHKQKSQDLIYALEHNVLPPPCTHRETWGGRKCKDYCNVWNFCEEGRKAHGLQ